MNYSEQIQKYSGVKLDLAQMSAYDQWALKLFRDPQIIQNPNLSVTTQLDITDAYSKFQSDGGAGFSSFLTWSLCRAIQAESCLNYRFLNGAWYAFDELPVFIPIATNDERRFGRIHVVAPGGMTWKEFSHYYQSELNDIRNKTERPISVGPEEFFISNQIGTLPDLQFTSWNFHTFAQNTGRQCVYFGKRNVVEGKLMIPFHITMDHANADPVVLNRLMECLQITILNGRD